MEKWKQKMIFLLKEIYKKNRLFNSFTIIELMVALSIVSIAVVASIGIFANASSWMSIDLDMQKAASVAENYLTDIYTSKNMLEKIFTIEELKSIDINKKGSVLFPPKRVDIEKDIFMYVNRNIRRWSPLLVDVGVEAIIDFHNKDKKNKKF